MGIENLISDFFLKIESDPRVTKAHISLYCALLSLWVSRGFASPLVVFSREVMPLAKISGVATYSQTIRDLHDFGHIKYKPSYSHFSGSEVTFLYKISLQTRQQREGLYG